MTYLSDLKKLAQAATPGPWVADRKWQEYRDCLPIHEPHGNTIIGTFYYGGTAEPMANAAYIAACSPERILAMIAVIEAAKAMRNHVGHGMTIAEAVAAFDAALAELETANPTR